MNKMKLEKGILGRGEGMGLSVDIGNYMIYVGNYIYFRVVSE